MSIDKVIGLVICVLVLIFLGALLVYGMRESLKLDKEFKTLQNTKLKLEIEKLKRELKWHIYNYNLEDKKDAASEN